MCVCNYTVHMYTYMVARCQTLNLFVYSTGVAALAEPFFWAGEQKPPGPGVPIVGLKSQCVLTIINYHTVH